MKKLFNITIYLLIIVCLFLCFLLYKKEKPSPSITVEEICTDYNLNKTSAIKKYAGKSYVIKGKISQNSINISEKHFLGSNLSFIALKYSYSVVIPGLFDYDEVICYLRFDEIEKLKKLKTGDNIKIKGIIDGSVFKSILVSGCSIVD